MTEDELFLTAIRNCSRSELYTRPVPVSSGEQEQREAMRRRRAAGEPVQYICGFTEFCGLRFDVGPGVLVPRPETEVLADALIGALRKAGRPVRQLLDIGTGSGCLAVTLLHAFPEARGVGVDLSAEALAYARRNAEQNGVAGRISFVEKDMFWFMDEPGGPYDAVVSNPPYIPTHALASLPADVRREPALALDGGPDGLHCYRFLVPTARRCLVPGGLLALEFGDTQRRELENLFRITGGWDKITVIADNAGRDRVLLAVRAQP